MAIEIERKFLVHGTEWMSDAVSRSILRQGFLAIRSEAVVRVRLADSTGTLTVKGRTQGTVRREYEYEISAADATEMLDHLCLRPLIEKTRYRVPYGDLVWEVDVFAGENQGLRVAEVELAEEGQQIDLPPWIGSEVTGDPRYYNSNLIQCPFSRWSQQAREEVSKAEAASHGKQGCT